MEANVNQITKRLWVGGDLSTDRPSVARAQLRDLQRKKIGHIIDVRDEWDDFEFVQEHAPEIGYTWLPIRDAGQQIPAEWWHNVIYAAETARKRGKTVLVHCHMGINRAPSAAFAILWSDRVERERKKDRPGGVPHQAQVDWALETIKFIHSRRPIAYCDYAMQFVRMKTGSRDWARLFETERRNYYAMHGFNISEVIRLERQRTGA